MSKKLYVGNLPYSMDNNKLEELFSKYGKITSVDVINDKFTNRSKGFAFVEMENDSEASQAITELNDKEIEGRKIVVNEAKPREERPRSPRPNGSYYGRSRGGRNNY